MTFTQRLGAGFLRPGPQGHSRPHGRGRHRPAAAQFQRRRHLHDRFSHYTTERPVVFAIGPRTRLAAAAAARAGPHAAHQQIAAEPVVYFEFPGVDHALRRAGRRPLPQAAPSRTATASPLPGSRRSQPPSPMPSVVPEHSSSRCGCGNIPRRSCSIARRHASPTPWSKPAWR